VTQLAQDAACARGRGQHAGRPRSSHRRCGIAHRPPCFCGRALGRVPLRPTCRACPKSTMRPQSHKTTFNDREVHAHGGPFDGLAGIFISAAREPAKILTTFSQHGESLQKSIRLPWSDGLPWYLSRYNSSFYSRYPCRDSGGRRLNVAAFCASVLRKLRGREGLQAAFAGCLFTEWPVMLIVSCAVLAPRGCRTCGMLCSEVGIRRAAG